MYSFGTIRQEYKSAISRRTGRLLAHQHHWIDRTCVRLENDADETRQNGKGYEEMANRGNVKLPYVIALGNELPRAVAVPGPGISGSLVAARR